MSADFPPAACRTVLAARYSDELDLDGGRWIVPAHFVDQAAELAAVTRAHGLEGVVFKRLVAPYLSGRRSAAWVKHNPRREQRVVVLGCRARDGGRRETFLLRTRGPGRPHPVRRRSRVRAERRGARARRARRWS